MSQGQTKEWLKVIPESEQQIYQKAGFHGDLKFGERPALIVVDVTYGFTGSEGLTLEQAIDEFPTACGPLSWEAVPKIARLIELFRSQDYPVVFTRGTDSQKFTGKVTKSAREGSVFRPGFNDFPAQIAPKEGEWVLDKTKASAFFQTPMTAYLTNRKVDTLILCGVSTSGCVRASTVDAFCHGYSTFVIDECCFDRSYFSHCTNLFDMNAKYASVVSLAELENIMEQKSESMLSR